MASITTKTNNIELKRMANIRAILQSMKEMAW